MPIRVTSSVRDIYNRQKKERERGGREREGGREGGKEREREREREREKGTTGTSLFICTVQLCR